MKNGANQDVQPTWLPDRGKRPPPGKQLTDFGPKADSQYHTSVKGLIFLWKTVQAGTSCHEKRTMED